MSPRVLFLALLLIPCPVQAQSAADSAGIRQAALDYIEGYYEGNAERMARAVVERHGGEIPADMAALVKLPGVGRKTANVVLGHALGVPGLPVDRHVLRVANRIGLVKSEDAEIVERDLTALLPPERWTRASDTLILHGRRICKPRPLCDRCHVRMHCDYFRRLGAKAAAARSRRPAAPRPRARKPAR